jgi:serine/threonine protein kinase
MLVHFIDEKEQESQSKKILKIVKGRSVNEFAMTSLLEDEPSMKIMFGGLGVSTSLKDPAVSGYQNLREPGYIDPLVLREEEVPGDKSDIFSLGCVLFEMLSSHTLIQRGETPEESVLLNKKASTAIILNRLESVLEDLCSANLKDLLSRMVTIDPHFRPTALQCLNHKWFKKPLGTRQLLIQNKNT